MTKEEQEALIESARKTPWLDAMKRRETEALLAALDEARTQLAALQAHVMRMDALDDNAERRGRAKVIAEVLGLYDGTNGCAAADLTPVIDAAQSLDRIASARIAALHAASRAVRWGLDPDEPQFDHAPNSSGGGWRDIVYTLDGCLADLATAAAEHERRVRADERAKALREAADELDARGEATRHPSEMGPQTWNPSGTVLTEAGAARCDEARWLRARAADLRGTR